MTDQQAGTADPAAADPGAAGPAQDVDAQDGDLDRRLAELEDRWRRAVADLDNMRKRVAGESARQREAERARVTTEWLPVLDNLDLALQHPDADPEALIEGILAIRNQALAAVSRLGYLRYGEPGVPFDPARHEVVATEPASTEVEAGTVTRVVRPGYAGNERQLRPAAVVVATRGE
jgi:molecular chaperone GrpE